MQGNNLLKLKTKLAVNSKKKRDSKIIILKMIKHLIILSYVLNVISHFLEVKIGYIWS